MPPLSAGGPGAAPSTDAAESGLEAACRQLVDLLGQMAIQVERLTDLEQQKALAVSARDLDELAAISQREEAVAATVRQLEDRRRRLVLRLTGGQALQPDNQEPSVTELADRLAEPFSSDLRAAASELAGTIGELRRLAQRNAGLLRWAADLAGSAAQWMLGATSDAAPAYTRSGDPDRQARLSARAWRA